MSIVKKRNPFGFLFFASVLNCVKIEDFDKIDVFLCLLKFVDKFETRKTFVFLFLTLNLGNCSNLQFFELKKNCVKIFNFDTIQDWKTVKLLANKFLRRRQKRFTKKQYSVKMCSNWQFEHILTMKEWVSRNYE